MNNEVNWIRGITPNKHHQQQLKVGIGDDAAIYGHDKKMESVVAVDTMVEGIHFTKQTMPMKSIGHKALAVNISDIAAMGAIPQYYLVSIAIPKTSWKKKELNDIYNGMNELATVWSMDLIGGDTVSTNDALVISVTVIGKVEKERRLLRSNARCGDVVFVTGELGLSAYGLQALLEKGYENIDDDELLPYLQAHQKPDPHVRAGRLLANCGYRIALNDISDGLASEAKEIADASQVTVELDWAAIPTTNKLKEYPQEKQEEWLLYGGEDFKLVGTIGKENWEKLKAAFQAHSLPIFKIGSILTGNSEVLLKKENKREVLKKTGYGHL
ncbi:thiamine-phosphate kinase [Evansella cellulosilytica]|uniref:Thiamine-monophosphate kinase n=1 Tax=Evansella cellulosilytica (strain ATCC 21833 / DSM 2522 / FERM P-1141 / JCM 9156 / N-4) TaxID=649639 RepID=E6TVT3_EVAC2|nr:thiamine-phosphate kinase [Evansella cellulosilytica]ADU28642.1 thiamine-monophosphate kinase [Evansella cellulosilytica DSM 2522]